MSQDQNATAFHFLMVKVTEPPFLLSPLEEESFFPDIERARQTGWSKYLAASRLQISPLSDRGQVAFSGHEQFLLSDFIVDNCHQVKIHHGHLQSHQEGDLQQ